MTEIYASIPVGGGAATLADLAETDIPAVVAYWHEADDAFLDFMGIDRELLGSPAKTEGRFRKAIRTGDATQMNAAFAIGFEGELVGYTLLNRYTPERNHSHWHIMSEEMRGKGLSSTLYPYRIKMYFDLFPIERLIHQTRTRNAAVNRMLDKHVPVAKTLYVEKPDGVAAPGEFNIRYVWRRDVPELYKRATSSGD